MDNNLVVYKHNNVYELLNNRLVVSYSTITTAIHLVALMGAFNIILVGHDCGILDNKCNTLNYHTKKTYKICWENGEDDYKNCLPKIENYTTKLKNILKKIYDCNTY